MTNSNRRGPILFDLSGSVEVLPSGAQEDHRIVLPRLEEAEYRTRLVAFPVGIPIADKGEKYALTAHGVSSMAAAAFPDKWQMADAEATKESTSLRGKPVLQYRT
jgi:hypothetical protein